MAKERTRPSSFKMFDKNMIALNSSEKATSEVHEELRELYSQNSTVFKVGNIVNAVIKSKDQDGVTVDLNYKSNSTIPAYEFNAVELKELEVGKELEVMIEEVENAQGCVVVSYEKAKADKAWKKITAMYENNEPVTGVVTSKVKGGLYVDIGINAFLPGSQIDTQRVTDFDQWIGQKVTAYVIKLIPKRGNVIISRRKYIYEQKSEQRKEIMDTLASESVINGIVKNVTKYGAFIDIGGVDGLLHITDMTWRRIDDPSEILKVGDEVRVKILSFDRDNEKISLGMKQLSENPWEQLAESVTVGSSVKGKVISIKDYGLFIEAAKGVEGLIHISEVSWTDRISDLHKHFSIGQEVEAVVVSLERKNRRMSLSIKQLEKNPWEKVCELYSVGQKVSGQITNIADFGFFVQIERGVDGLVHVSDISWTQHIKHPEDMYKVGDVVDAVITDINKQKRKISLSIKELQDNPWKTIAEKLPVNNMVKGEVIKITEFGAFVRLEESDIEAFIHTSECSDKNQSAEDVLKVGHSYTFRVIRVAADEQKVGLSLRSKSAPRKPAMERKTVSRNKPAHSSVNAEAASASSSGGNKKSALQLELEKLMNKK